MGRRRNKLRSYLHIVWATKYRTPFITEAIEDQVLTVIEAIFRANKCEVLAINGMPDHIHVLILLPTTIGIGSLMGRVKGGSSRIIADEIAPDGAFQWQPHYGIFTVSESHRKRVIRYINNQKQHHLQGTIWPNAEETDEEDPEGDEEESPNEEANEMPNATRIMGDRNDSPSFNNHERHNAVPQKRPTRRNG